MSAKRLANKVAIITGGGTGIGEAICHTFAALGAKVVVNGLPGDPVDEVAAAIRDQGGEAVAIAADVSDEAEAKRCIDEAVKTFGHLDILVNNAGILLVNAPTEEFGVDQLDEHLRHNVRTTFLMTKLALPHLQKTKGNIISAGSEGGINGQPRNTPYGGTKGFIHSFMKGVAVEQAQYGVRANCVCPGPVDTAWTHKETGAVDAQIEEVLVGAVPLGRRGTVEEIANVYAFLASDEASFVTGALWLVDGGITPAKGMMGQLARPDVAKAPSRKFALKHTQDGLQNKKIVKK